MKKLFYVFVLLAGSVSLYAAETVSSVSFNPSRMGDYTYLKVANKATLKGGLKTPEMNISVGGTISAEYSPNDSSRVYVINQLMGNPTSAIDMEQAVFHGNIAAQYTGYKSESSLLPAGLLPLMTIYGGNQTYLNDSYIQTLDAVNMLRQRAGELKSSALSVLGSGGGNTGKDLSNCTLVWEKRKTSTTPAKEVWLLALKDCISTGGSQGTESDKYQWKVSGTEIMTSSNANGFCSVNACWVSGSSDPFATTLPDTLPADTFGNVTCSDRLLGTTCRHQGGPYTNNTVYCITYTCSTK